MQEPADVITRRQEARRLRHALSARSLIPLHLHHNLHPSHPPHPPPLRLNDSASSRARSLKRWSAAGVEFKRVWRDERSVAALRRPPAATDTTAVTSSRGKIPL